MAGRSPAYPFRTTAIGEHFDVSAFETSETYKPKAGQHTDLERRLKAALRMYRLRSAPDSQWLVTSPDYGIIRITRTA